MFYLAAISFISQFTFGQNKNNINITGDLKGLKDSFVYLSKLTQNKLDTIGVCKAKNGKFYFSNITSTPAEFFFLQMEKSISNNSKTLLIEDNDISITGDFLKWPYEVIVTGSKAQRDLEMFSKLDLASKKREIDQVDTINSITQQKRSYLQLNDSTNAMKIEQILKIEENKLKQIQNDRFFAWTTFIKNNSNSFYSPFLISTMIPIIGIDSAAILSLSLSPVAQKSLQGHLLNEKLSLLANSKKIETATFAPDFQTILLGDTTTFYNLIAKNKYTLVDFWASWCAPCRANFPHLKELYQKYKSKGLDILSISTDKSKDKWKKALENDSLPWLNILDNYLLETKTISILYGIERLPTMFLIDSKGEIISRTEDLLGNDLDLKLKKLLD